MLDHRSSRPSARLARRRRASFAALAAALTLAALASCGGSPDESDEEQSPAGSGGSGGSGGALAGGNSGSAGQSQAGGAGPGGASGAAGKGGSSAGAAGASGGAGGGAAGGASGGGGAGPSGGASGSATAGSAGASGSATAGGAGGGATGGNGGSAQAGQAGQAGVGGAGGQAGVAGQAGAAGAPPGPSSIQTVFVVLMENHNWKDIKGNAKAPYLNSLLDEGAHCEAYTNPKGIHPSEPNYLWLEAGKNFGVLDDKPPSVNHQSSKQHLATLLKDAGVSWRAYQEDIDGTTCPLTAVKNFVPRHDPFVFFDDSTGGLDPKDSYCIKHNRPYGELAADLTGNTVARYNFLTPNLCHDMHDSCAPTNDPIKQGDSWLADHIPKILASDAYKNNGAIFITWDESEGGDFPIGMIVLSPLVKKGYSSKTAYDHSSTLRTMQMIFGVKPFLGAAADAPDLFELFSFGP